MIRAVLLALLLVATAAHARPRHVSGHLSWDWLAYGRWLAMEARMTRADLEFDRCRLINTPAVTGDFAADYRAGRIAEIDCRLGYRVRVLP